MDVKEAVAVAKSWLTDVMADEQIMNLGLEEVEFDENRDVWTITLGFSRPWNTTRNALTAIAGEPAARRALRSLVVDNASGQVKAMKRLETSSN
ncbi:MAG TPA: hypothetical protein VIL72_05100 [Beijerinckiaceae bacterium]|jgi:hypothetical protein